VISRKELNPKDYVLTPKQAANFERLFTVMNEIRKAYGKPMIVTSGVRSEVDQARINPKAPGSAHIQAAACDISDADRDVWGWCMDNLPLLEHLGVYLEDKSHTPRWVHFQVIPPRSGNRVFLP
jgi:hypothetical protein